MRPAMLVLAALLQGAAAPSGPPLPYYNHGACPFECCTYRDWTATAATTAFEHYDPPGRTRTLFRVAPKEVVTAMTGVVITTRAGRVRIDAPTTITVYSESFPRAKPEKLELRPRETLYLLRSGGEGYYRGWYGGRVLESFDSGDYTRTGVEESRPETEWWARVRNRAGRIGWVRVRENFSNVDACGG